MSLLEDAQVISTALSSIKEEFLIREIILTHDPDDHCLDSELLLHLVEGALHPSTENGLDAISTRDIDLSGSEEPISLIIYKISNQIVSQCFEDGNLHKKTLLLLEMLSRYRWDAKVVIALASFMHRYMLFQLISQLQSDNALADSLATFKQIPRVVTKLMPRFKAMNLLIYTVLKVTKIIIRFEGMSLQHELVDANVLGITKSKIYMATYWILRSILLCSSEIAEFKNLDLDEQVYLDKTVIAAWGLHTAGSKLNSLCTDLGEHVDKCQQQIDARLYEKLLNVLKEKQVDNQKVLRTLFALQNEFSLKNSTSENRCGILELKNKVVILLISKPDIMPLDKIFWLVQQTYDHPQRKKLQGSYAILWIPISSLCEWSLDEKSSFEFFSNYLPWFSIRRPWLLNPTIVKYIRQEWNFMEDPRMVVLNENGVVSNTDAMDLVWIWGLKAFPFSASREKEIWELENWIQDVMISAGLVGEGKDLCIYGSDDRVWIRQFSAAMKKMKSSGIELEVVYVGCRNPGENVKAIIDKLCTSSLTFRMVQLFWNQLERIKRWMDDHQEEVDRIGSKVAPLVKLMDEKEKGWAMMSTSTDVLKLDAEMIQDCIEALPLWGKNVATMGIVGAIRSALQQQQQAAFGGHTEVTFPYEEAGLVHKRLICGWCKRPMDEFVLYKCCEE